MKQIGLFTLTFAIPFVMLGNVSAQTGTFVYDFSTAPASSAGTGLFNNDNWTLVGGGASGDDIVRNAGHPDGFFTGNYFTTTEPAPRLETGLVSLFTRENDNAFSYSIPANAATVDLSFILQASIANNASRFGLQGSRVVSFGVHGGISGPGKWGVRQVVDGPGGFGVTEANGTAAAMLDNTVRTYRANLSLDLTNPGTLKSVDLVIDNLTDGGSEVIFDDLPFELGAEADPSQWSRIYLRSTATSVDDLTISYTVPEPASILLLGALSGLGCLMRFRW